MLTRRLIGPTVITLMTCVLWVDYVFFRESPWSVINFLSKILAIVIKIFGPLFDPALYWWIGEIVIPAGMIVCAIILLYVSVAKAKVAMSQATPKVDEMVPLPRQTSTAETEPMNVAARARVILSETPARTGDFVSSPLPRPASMPEPLQAGPVAAKPPSKPWKFGLAEKLTGSFGALAIIFCATVSIIAYTRLAGLLETEMKRRAGLSIMGLSEVAKRYSAGRGEQELRNVVSNHISNSSIAYIYVEDAEGRIIAHMPRELPAFLRRDFPKTGERAVNGVEVEYRGSPVYEVAARVGEPRPGYVHLAVWRGAVEAEARRVVTSIVTSILILLCAAIAVFAWAVWYLTLPLTKLVQYAKRISDGELDLDIEIKENEAIKESDEVGSLARSFARMRSSLHAVVTRLEKMEPNERSRKNL